MRNESRPDPEIGAALRAVGPEPPETVDWERLRRVVVARAAAVLAQRRTVLWWEHAARWARPLAPLAAAASIALAVLVARDAGPATGPAIAEAGLEETLQTAVDPEGAAFSLLEDMDTDALLQAALLVE